MVKKYIKNCTGDECDEDRLSGRKSSFSAVVSKIIFYILSAGFVVVLLYVLFFSQYLQILNIEVTGTREIGSQEIRQRIESALQGKHIGIIPKNNFMFITQGNVDNILKGEFKKIRTVTLTKKFPDTVSVNIDERKALLVWCSENRCYLLDENGSAYSEADFNSQEFIQNNLLQISDTSGREIAVGENVIEVSYEKYVLGIKEALSSTGLNDGGKYFTPSRMAEEIRVKTQEGPELYFSMQFSLESAIATLDTILKKEIPSDRIGDVEYIDLRNENKVFYKFKIAELEKTQVEKVEEKTE